ncbi:sigma-70 family RNA polymerase sigma factor [Microlunatus elymi]|uniref:Sigma-70 family RNA polymerase sigma factor n=1 Tax=Microlunatus elymi TaxID=2596828 RepID=A0A516PV55_9ACTN|nr:RNA polymerase subunit sigma-70 [Microlunatus elymi]QDP94831.1 sigma-70 family RNA polymerase sigma factor [Microlunatus elymi]
METELVHAEEQLRDARAGSQDAFDQLIAPFRRELLTHSYRMLGSLQDAEDCLQESLLAAWQALPGFEARSSLRTWLYAITTNRCLNALRAIRRRPAQPWAVPGMQPPEPSRLGEVVWLEPLPDRLIGGSNTTAATPEARYEARESISLAFVTALQRLPPRQLTVLVLRDVLGFHAREVAEILQVSVESVTSALKRARSTLQRHRDDEAGTEPPPESQSPIERELIARFVTAYEAGDVAGLIELFTDDVMMSMPPVPLEYQGPELVGEFLSLLFGADRRFRLLPTRANGQPAFGLYLRRPDRSCTGSGLLVLGLSGDRISSLIRFEPELIKQFDLPAALTDS